MKDIDEVNKVLTKALQTNHNLHEKFAYNNKAKAGEKGKKVKRRLPK